MLGGRDSSAATSVLKWGTALLGDYQWIPEGSWLQHPGREQGNISQGTGSVTRAFTPWATCPTHRSTAWGPTPIQLWGIESPRSGLC